MYASDDGTHHVFDVMTVWRCWPRNALAEMQNCTVKKIFLGKSRYYLLQLLQRLAQKRLNNS